MDIFISKTNIRRNRFHFSSSNINHMLKINEFGNWTLFLKILWFFLHRSESRCNCCVRVIFIAMLYILILLNASIWNRKRRMKTRFILCVLKQLAYKTRQGFAHSKIVIRLSTQSMLMLHLRVWSLVNSHIG